MTREQTEKELLQMPEHVVYLTGDTHGRFNRIEAFCRGRDMDQENTFIILGDVGLNYFGDFRDWPGKEQLARLPCTFFCIHGNHEQRPTPLMGYQRSEYHGGAVWVEPQFPNIVFAIDGEVYDFCGHSCLVIGGAYSVDKWYRLGRGFHWWPDEQPSPEIKAYVEQQIREKQFDIVLSHTCPFKYEPTEMFLGGIDQRTVDDSTERWLDTIEESIQYKAWFCGHWHTDKRIDKMHFLFRSFESDEQFKR